MDKISYMVGRSSEYGLEVYAGLSDETEEAIITREVTGGELLEYEEVANAIAKELNKATGSLEWRTIEVSLFSEE